MFPISTRKDWLRIYKKLSTTEKIHPFKDVVDFLKEERDVAIRLDERHAKTNDNTKSSAVSKATNLHVNTDMTNKENESKQSAYKKLFIKCAIHQKATSHSTAECNQFKKLDLQHRLESLKSSHACFRCLDQNVNGKVSVVFANQKSIIIICVKSY